MILNLKFYLKSDCIVKEKFIRKKIFEDNVTTIKLKVYIKMSKSQAPSPNYTQENNINWNKLC
jgi:hypothetical protein